MEAPLLFHQARHTFRIEDCSTTRSSQRHPAADTRILRHRLLGSQRPNRRETVGDVYAGPQSPRPALLGSGWTKVGISRRRNPRPSDASTTGRKATMTRLDRPSRHCHFGLSSWPTGRSSTTVVAARHRPRRCPCSSERWNKSGSRSARDASSQARGEHRDQVSSAARPCMRPLLSIGANAPAYDLSCCSEVPQKWKNSS